MAQLEITKTIGNDFGNLAKPVGYTTRDGKIRAPMVDDHGHIITTGDTATVDTFGRSRVSRILPLFDIQNRYGLVSDFWGTKTVGAGSISHITNESSMLLSVGTASGDRAVSQTKIYYPYQPGRTQILIQTFCMKHAKENLEYFVGLGDDENGLFLRKANEALYFVVRSKVSGSVIDSNIPQSTWNLDRLDGTGGEYNPSGINIDSLKAQIFLCDFQYLGVGTVRFGFSIGGVLIYCHEEHHANINTGVYMSTANLPVRYEIKNVGTTTSASELKQICTLLGSEDGLPVLELPGVTFCSDNDNNLISIGTSAFVPLLSIRLKTTYNGLTNRGIVIPLDASVFPNSGNVLYRMYWNATLGGSPSFSSVNANSIVEYDVSASSISGGNIRRAGYTAAKDNILFGNLASKILMGLNIDGTSSDVLTIAAKSLGGTVRIGAALNWKEVI